MQRITGINWGANKNCLMLIYKSLLKSRFEYCAPAIASMSEKNRSKLETIHRTALCLALDVIKNTNNDAIFVESGEKPLKYLYHQKTLQYHFTGKPYSSNPINTACENIKRETRILLKCKRKPTLPHKHRITQNNTFNRNLSCHTNRT